MRLPHGPSRFARRPASLAAGWRADARQAARALAHTPGHAVAVVLCLAIGMVVSVAVFSIANSLLYGDIPGTVDRQSLARVFISYESAIGTENLGRAGGSVQATELSLTDVEVFGRVPNSAFSSIGAEGQTRMGVTIGERSSGAVAAFVSEDYFKTLGTIAAHGRLLTPDDDRADAPPVAVLGYHLWRDRFDARPDIIGQSILAAGRPFTIVGVAPPRFAGIRPNDRSPSPEEYLQLWLPLHISRNWPSVTNREASWFEVVGRVLPTSTKEEAQVQTGAAAAQLAALHPDSRRNASFVVRSHGFTLSDAPYEVLAVLTLVMSVPLSVLAIACANVANLQLARATRRSREIAVRLALGASRSQVIRLLTFEALAMAIIAAVLGIVGAHVALTKVQEYFPLVISTDVRVVFFTCLIAGGATLLSGLAPAWLVARRQSAGDLRQTAQSGGLQHGRFRSTLVVTQIALSLALLTICALFTRSAGVVARDVPVELREILRANLDVIRINGTVADAAHLQETLLARLSADSRVRAAAIEAHIPFLYRSDPSSTTDSHLWGGHVTPRWLEASGGRLLSGRTFTASDRADVGIVNEAFGKEIAPDGSPLGKVVQVRRDDTSPRLPVTIVGVVATMPNSPMDQGQSPELYVPIVETTLAPSLVVRVTDAAAMTPEIRRLVTSIEPRLTWIPVETGDVSYLRGADPLTTLSLSLGAFGLVALVLAAGGQFAMMAYVVSLRTRELGIRVALGARAGDVLGLVVRQALRLAIYGALVGLTLAIPIAFALRALFIGISPVDALAITPAVGLLFIVAIAAAAVPARRAARVDPVSVLRDL